MRANRPFRSQRAGGGGEKGAHEWEGGERGGVHRRVERRRRRSGSEFSHRDQPYSDDGEGGESPVSRDEHRNGERNGRAGLKGSVDRSGRGDDGEVVDAKAAAGAGTRGGPSDAVGSEDAAVPGAAGAAERGNADGDGNESDEGRSAAAGQHKGSSSRARSGSGRGGGEKRSRRRHSEGAAGSGGARRHSDGGRYLRDSSLYPANGVAHQAGFGYPPGGGVDPRFAPPTAQMGFAPGPSSYMMPPPHPHGLYFEGAGWGPGGSDHPGRSPAHAPSHHKLPSYDGGNVSRRRKTRSPGPDPAGGERGANASGGGFAERGGGRGGSRSRSRSGSWDSE